MATRAGYSLESDRLRSFHGGNRDLLERNGESDGVCGAAGGFAHGSNRRVATFFPSRSVVTGMRDEDEIREQYEFLKEHLESDEMRHDGVEEMFTYYKRAIGWVLEEEHI